MILGICGVVRAEQMAGAFIVILGIVLLLSGIIVMQHSLDLRRMNDVIWIPTIIIACIILLAGIMVTIQPMPQKIKYELIVWWMLLISSILGLIINIYTIIRVSLFKKKEKKLEEQTKETLTDEPEAAKPAENEDNSPEDTTSEDELKEESDSGEV